MKTCVLRRLIWTGILFALPASSLMGSINIDNNPPYKLDDHTCTSGCNYFRVLQVRNGSIVIQYPLKGAAPGSGISGAGLIFQQNALDETSFSPIPLKLIMGDAPILYSHWQKTSSNDPENVIFRDSHGQSHWFTYKDNESSGNVEGREEVLQQKLQMVDAQGQPVTQNPHAYKLTKPGGMEYTYLADPSSPEFGKPVEMKDPNGRTVDLTDVGFEFIRGSENEYRQVLGPEVFVDIITLSADSYELRVYSPDAIDPVKVGGLYTLQPGAQILERYTVTNPNPGTLSSLKLVADVEGEVTTYTFTYQEAADQWALDVVGPGGPKVERFKEKSNDQNGLYQQTAGWKWDQDNVVYEKEVLELEDLNGIPRRTRMIQDPDGLALQTVFTYHTDTNSPHKLNRLKTRTSPDGSWVGYNYDTEGRPLFTLRPWLDSPAVAPSDLSANLALGDVTLYEYTPHSAEDTLIFNDSRPRTVTRQILGQTVSKTYYVYGIDAQGARYDLVEQAYSPTAAYGDPLNLTRVTRYYSSAAGVHAGRMHQTETPDGQLTTYVYAYGDWDEQNQTFTVNASGAAFQTIVTRGTVLNPNGIAYETTRRIAIQNAKGLNVRTESEVYTGSGYEQIAWDKREYDAYGQLSRTENSRGEITEYENQASCCSADSMTNAQGITTKTQKDAWERVSSRTKVHPSGDTDKDLITAYTLDAAGRVLMEETKDGAETLSLISSYLYDGTGRRIQSTPHTGGTTVMDYDDLNRITIQTNPDGSTVITERYLDGRTKSVTGTAVTAQYYEYGVTATGNRWTKVSTGPALAASPMWTKSYTNPLGQSIATERPGHDGTILASGQSYNDKGQLIESTPAVGASTRYEYDELSDQIVSYLDVNNNDTRDDAGPDRITMSETSYVSDLSDHYWMETKSYIYDDGEDTPTLTGISRQRLTGLSGVEAGKGTLVAESVSIDIHGNTSTSKRYLDRATQTALSEQDSSLTTATPDASSVNINGLTTETKSLDPNSPASPVAYLTTTFDYDELERRIGTTDPRTGRSFVTYVPGKNLIAKQTDAAGNETLFAYYSGTDRRKSVTDPNGNVTSTAYTEDGQVATTWGATYPVVYTYDAYDRMETLHTLRDPNTTFSPTVDPATGILTSDLTTLTSPMDNTTWVYEEATGLLLQKTYDDGNGPSYTYTPDGRLATREWARSNPAVPAGNLTTTYTYVPNTLELATTTYSDGTATVTNSYDRLGRLKTTDDAFGQKAYSYNDELQPEEEAWTGLVNQTLTRTYKSDGRPEGISLLTGYDTVINYSPLTGHLDTLVWTGANNLSHTTDYHYVTNSQMIEGYTLGDLQRTVTYEPNRNLVDDITNTVIPQSPAGNILISKFDYTNDAGGRRTNREDTGTAFASTQANVFGYNARNEVTSAAMRNGTSTYNFDQIGNRVDAAVPAALTSPAQNLSYISNALNQYTSITEGGTPSTPQYDDDGNLLNNGSGKTHTWTGENRLEVFTEGNTTVENTYDGQGRRVRKLVKELGAVTKDLRFMYDGWNLLYEVDMHQTSQPTRRYVWGLDLSQSMQGAGGVGGLLFTESDTVTHGVTYDANGNISEYIDLANGNITAHLEYDAFGRTIANTFGAAPAPFGFSTKYQDEESGYYYYGFRYYDPETGRWLNRDPIEENGGINLYQMIFNDPLGIVDTLGLSGFEGFHKHHWFARLGGAGYEYARSKCPCLNIDDYTTPIEGGYTNSPHSWLHARNTGFSYNDKYQILTAGSTGCCDFMLRTYTLALATWMTLAYERRNNIFPGLSDGNPVQRFRLSEFTLVEFRRNGNPTLVKFHGELAANCGDDLNRLLAEAAALALGIFFQYTHGDFAYYHDPFPGYSFGEALRPGIPAELVAGGAIGTRIAVRAVGQRAVTTTVTSGSGRVIPFIRASGQSVLDRAAAGLGIFLFIPHLFFDEFRPQDPHGIPNEI